MRLLAWSSLPRQQPQARRGLALKVRGVSDLCDVSEDELRPPVELPVRPLQHVPELLTREVLIPDLGLEGLVWTSKNFHYLLPNGGNKKIRYNSQVITSHTPA